MRAANADRVLHEWRNRDRIEVVLVAFGHDEVAWQHTDDRSGDVVQPDGLANDVLGAAEHGLPCLPGDDGDKGGIAQAVFLAEVHPFDESDAKRGEERRLDPAHFHDLRVVTGVVDRLAGWEPRAERAE